jgi:hypothetical protein
MDATYKTAYAAHEAAQERAAYEAKMARDDALAATSTWKPTRWELERLREGKAHRDANPATTDEGRAEDAWLDAMLVNAEVSYATQGAAVDTTQDAGELSSPVRRSGPGARTWTADPASPAQLRFIASLARDLGRELDTPADKKHASRIIDAAKAELDKARRSGTTAAPAARPERKATERQAEFLADLLNERAHDLGEIDPAELSAARASALIAELLSAPRAAVAAHGIREGRYAYTPDGGTTADHYRVRRDGKIVVWTAGGEWPYNGKLNEGLEWIKANPREAAELFGRLTETCGRCGRELSDDDSRARGLGPVCAGKTEW